MVESVSKHLFNLLKAKRVEEHGNHLDKDNAKDLDMRGAHSECGDGKKRERGKD